MSLEDRKALADFVAKLDEFIITGLRRNYPDVPFQTSRDLLELWSLQADRIARVPATLGQTTARQSPPPPFEAWQDVDAALAERGLTGRELAIKLRAFETAAREHEQRPSPTKLSTALAAADVPLGSLSRLFGFLDPVVEAKQTIEVVFAWTRGWLRRRWPKPRA